MDLYALGILWSIGSPIEDRYPYFMLRHHDRYFLDVVHEALNVSTSVFAGEARTGSQYKLKIFKFDLRQLIQYGWQSRISDQRKYPDISEHADFIRAYFELHSTIDTLTVRKRGKERRSPRLRIYGNRYFLDQLTEVLNSQAEISPKRVQRATKYSKFSGILYYQSRRELEKLLDYLYPPDAWYFHRGYYEQFRAALHR
ncbi:Hypothetical protein DEACI_1513 [Acididesulfobacillus acetoxydans]|uniref:Uncharacterized protein n=1 Tax=Acididesulfobacillus acetoxydans TaxID=1561005 RepID=A0A8S0X4K5_9FIRM|nr:hypothetical protein [Acididesulfobacillus acetoxydans]CAA7600860.1 Hypothetical protein DEACI_1513 [Acididesulfobacillus acetoxydans]CEJ07209.1 Hypothetical protein DEACI_1667 [Acididesulfobacillus acetoxydans]